MLESNHIFSSTGLRTGCRTTPALCEEGDEFSSELVDCVSSACTGPSEDDDYYDGE